MQMGCAEVAERIDVLFGMWTPGDSDNIVLDGDPHPPMARGGSLMRFLPNYFGLLVALLFACGLGMPWL